MEEQMTIAFTALTRWTQHHKLHLGPDYEISSCEALYAMNSLGDAGAGGILTIDNLHDWLLHTIELNRDYEMDRPTIDFLSSKLIGELARSGKPYQLYCGGYDLKFERWIADHGAELCHAYHTTIGYPYDDDELVIVRRAIRDSDYSPASMNNVLTRALSRTPGRDLDTRDLAHEIYNS